MLIITAPGQGAQTPGFLAPWLDLPGVAERLGTASELAGCDLIRFGTTASADEIKDTAVAPNLMRSHPASSEAAPRRSATPGSSSQGARKPGVCAPCPGAVMISILQPCPVGHRQMNVERYEVTRRKFVAYL